MFGYERCGECGEVGCERQVNGVSCSTGRAPQVTAAGEGHPDSVVCPCNGFGPPPCPYLTPAPIDVLPWYGAQPLAPLRAAWTCPRCDVVNAPHVDRCTCTPRITITDTTDTVK